MSEETAQKEVITTDGEVVPIGTPGTDDSLPVIGDQLTVEEKYGIALKITCPVLARQYLDALTDHTIRTKGKARKEALVMERTNIAWLASKRGDEVFQRARTLYSDPPKPPSPEDPAPAQDKLDAPTDERPTLFQRFSRFIGIKG
jgi:hypothetical protein